MGEVDTQELEIQILKLKAERLLQHATELAERSRKREITTKELVYELKKDRKELVDCATLQLRMEVVGPVAALVTVETISRLDALLMMSKALLEMGL